MAVFGSQSCPHLFTSSYPSADIPDKNDEKDGL